MALSVWAMELLQWSVGLGKPLVIGLVLLAGALAIAGYLAVRGLYRWHLIRAWRARSMRRKRESGG